MEAETSLQEEQVLQRYFTEEEVPAHLEEYRSMFAFFASTANETLKPPAPPKRLFNSMWIRVAASVVIALGTYAFFVTEQNRKEKEALEAYEQTRLALDLISENLNKGTRKLAYLNQFEVAKRKVIKN